MATPSLAATIPQAELLRKFLHTIPGLLPFLLARVPHPDPLDTVSLGVVTTITVFLTGVFLVCHRIVRRENESNFLSTTLSYPATVLLTLILFPGHAEFACVVVVVLAFGDTAAYVGGRMFGKRPLPWNAEKTWTGSFCFVLGAAPLAALAYWAEARPEVPFSMALLCGGAAALAGAAAESLSTRITDNLRIGVSSAAAVVAVHFLFAHWMAP